MRLRMETDRWCYTESYEEEEEGFITKGDANDREDFQPVSAEDLIGILAVRFPKGSWLYEMMSSKTMRRVLLLSGLVRIVVYFFRRFSR